MSIGEQPRRGVHSYDGFKATIKAIGTGPRGSRDLGFDEAREAMRQVLAGEVADVQAGAFLVAMRIKGEAEPELAGIVQGLRDAAAELPGYDSAPLISSAGAFDGVTEAPHLSLAAAACTAACGAGVVLSCGGALGPKFGVTPADVLSALGGPARPSLEESDAMLRRSGVTLVHVGEAIDGWDRLAELRNQIGVRGPVHSAEKLIDWFGARRFVVGHTHAPYAGRLVGALGVLGADAAISVRGIEGSDVLRPGRPAASDTTGPLDLPERLGATIRGGASGATESANLTAALLRGEENGVAAYTVALSAGVQLYAAGLATDPAAGIRRATAALEDGAAAAVLDALLG